MLQLRLVSATVPDGIHLFIIGMGFYGYEQVFVNYTAK